MTDVLSSVDVMLESAADFGPWVRSVNFPGPGTTTAAGITSGYLTGQRYGSFATPSFATGLKGMYLTQCRMGHLAGANSVSLLCALEYTLGTLTVSGNYSFADGVVMPSKVVRGLSVQTASLIPVLFVSTTLTAVTPAVTITYKNQGGTGSRSAVLTLPTNAAIGSVFQIAPHFQAGDSAMQDVTGMSIDTGTAGVVKVMGLLPLGAGLNDSFVQGQNSIDPLASPWPVFLVEASENIAVYRFGRKTTNEGILLSCVGIAQPA